jgi:hypothetical protein
MIASALIIIVSSALLIYWFRYTCVLILQTHTAKDYASDLAAANRLKFPNVQGRLLQGAPIEELPALQKALEADYLLLSYLIQHTAGLEVGGVTLEQRMLMLDFKVMRLFCALSLRLGVPQARAALSEMSSVLNHLANAMGERIQATSRA